MLSITQTVYDTVCRENLFSPDDTVYVALSGGADSVVLLHILCALKDKLSLKAIRALHVNHGLRGDCADRDEAFVRELCDTLQIPLCVEHADVPSIVKATHKSVEEAARDVRYAFFKRATDGVEGAKIATAHTADDRAETVLLHLIRGCGLRGLRGIPYQRDNIVRPLLDCTSQEVRTFAATQGYAYVCDETNTDEKYTRNYIRHRILPAVKEVNPAAVAAILRLSDLAAADDAYLQNAAENLLKTANIGKDTYACDPIAEAPDSIATRALVTACVNASDLYPEQRHVDELLHAVRQGGSVSLRGDFIAKTEGDTLRFYKAKRNKTETDKSLRVPLSTEKPMCFLNRLFMARILTSEDFSKKRKIHKNLLDFAIDYDMISGSMYLRTRQKGDTFRPYKRGCTKTLKQFFQEKGVPVEHRDLIPLLCDDCGILAVLGYAVDERAAITHSASNILYIEALPEGSE